jgi:hypothetical protein
MNQSLHFKLSNPSIIFFPFKTCQEQHKKVEMEKNAEGERGHSSADSYSDLSDLGDVFSSEEENNEKEEEGEEGGTEDAEKKNKAKEKKKKQKARRRQPKMCLYFPNAFAHRDLTPPELALGYALRQFCRVCWKIILLNYL